MSQSKPRNPASSFVDCNMCQTDKLAVQDPFERFQLDHMQLWQEQLVYIRAAMKARALNLPDAGVQTARLLRNQTDLANFVEPIAGRAFADKMHKVLRQYIMLAVTLLEVASGENRSLSLGEVRAKLEQNGAALVAHLASLQADAPRKVWDGQMVTEAWLRHLDLVQAAVVAMLRREWEEMNAAYDKALTNLNLIGRTIARGVVQLAPEAVEKLSRTKSMSMPEGSSSSNSSSSGSSSGSGMRMMAKSPVSREMPTMRMGDPEGYVERGGRGENSTIPFFYEANPSRAAPQRQTPAEYDEVPDTERDTETDLLFPANVAALNLLMRREPVVVLVSMRRPCAEETLCEDLLKMLMRLGREMRDVVVVYNDVDRQVRIRTLEMVPNVRIYANGYLVTEFRSPTLEEGVYRRALDQALMTTRRQSGASVSADAAGESVDGQMSMMLRKMGMRGHMEMSDDEGMSVSGTDNFMLGRLNPVENRNQLQEVKRVIKRTQDRGTDVQTVVLMYGADWCGYCRKAKPKVEKLAQKTMGDTLFVLVDTNKPMNTYDGPIPRFFIYRDGRMVATAGSSDFKQAIQRVRRGSMMQ